MDAFVSLLHEEFEECSADIHAWSLLPNHYHVLTTTPDLTALLARLGQLHGSTSFTWNGEDDARGQKCWHRATDRAMRSEENLEAAAEYLVANPVRAGLVGAHSGHGGHWFR